MQKIINAIAIASGVSVLAIVGAGGYVYLNRSSIIEGVKENIMEQVTGALPGVIGNSLPSVTGSVAVPDGGTMDSLALPVPNNPIP
tara:strand:- start:2087 stop:2344 length:258 start_codon:yes stop_codon:yes gene_type:complete